MRYATVEQYWWNVFQLQLSKENFSFACLVTWKLVRSNVIRCSVAVNVTYTWLCVTSSRTTQRCDKRKCRVPHTKFIKAGNGDFKIVFFGWWKKIVIRPCRTLGDRGKYMIWCHIQEQRNGLVTKLSWWAQTVQTDLEDYKRLGDFHDCAWVFFTVHISAESCTVNLLYGISKLLCKIDQRELEYFFKLTSLLN